MKWILYLAPIFLFATGSNGGLIGGGCNISTGTSGTGNVTFFLSPSPQDALSAAAAALGPLSPSQVFTTLNQGAALAQSVINAFGGKLVNCQYYWIANAVSCYNVNLGLIRTVCLIPGVIANVTAPISFPTPPVLPAPSSLPCEADINNQPYGLTQMGAPCAWSGGINGSGIVVANIDTGVRGTHVELVGNMRPTFNWFDPYSISTVPTDVYGHGTHTMGTMVGKTVGMAPGAQWIACRGCDSSTCGQDQMLACAQWLACPDLKTQSCNTKPHIINMSIGSTSPGVWFADVLATWKAMNITGFISAGNSGPVCSTLNYPASSNWNLYSFAAVGAVACSDAITSFSSVGPSNSPDYPGGLGPQIVGSGQNIRSAWNTSDTDFQILSGTSMSSPGTAGAGALLLSNNKGQTPAQLLSLMTSTAYKNPNVVAANSPALYCTGPNPSSSYPNNVYGYGRVDVCLALGQPNPYNSGSSSG